MIDKLFLACGKQPDCIFEIDEDQTIAGFVANGFGIAVVPNMPILTNMHLKVIHITEANWERRFYIAYLKNRYRTPLAGGVSELCEEPCSDLKKACKK